MSHHTMLLLVLSNPEFSIENLRTRDDGQLSVLKPREQEEVDAFVTKVVPAMREVAVNMGCLEVPDGELNTGSAPAHSMPFCHQCSCSEGLAFNSRLAGQGGGRVRNP